VAGDQPRSVDAGSDASSRGRIIGDNLRQFYGELVFAIAPSPIQRTDLGWNDDGSSYCAAAARTGRT
jgi:hypothetical protein